MLEIDEAGWGCLVGGVVIGCYRIGENPDAQEGPCFVSGVVGPYYFQNDDSEEPNRCARRRYLAAATETVATCFARLKATPAEPVQIAPGPVLDGVRSWLSEARYCWQPGRITGAWHAPLAQAWQLHLAELGFSAGIDLLTNPERAGLFWWRQVQWLKGGDVQAVAPDPKRAVVCKTGWAAYPTWAYHPYSQARALAAHARRQRAQGRAAR